jgi:hypothetical protein
MARNMTVESRRHAARVAAVAAVAAVAMLATACAATSPARLPSPSASSVTASAHGWTTLVAVSGNHVDIRVMVSGPLSVEAGCVPPLAVWLVGADGRRLEPSPTPGLRCQAIAIEDIPMGQVRGYRATIPLAPPGTYMVHGLIRVHLPIGAAARVSENIPVVTLQVGSGPVA